MEYDENSPKYRIVKKYKLNDHDEQIEYFIVEKLYFRPSSITLIPTYYYTNDSDAYGTLTYFPLFEDALTYVESKIKREQDQKALPADEVMWTSKENGKKEISFR